MSDWGNFYAPPPASMMPPPPPPPPPPPVDYALPAGISYAPSTGLQDAAASMSATDAFNARQAYGAGQAQNAWTGVTSNLTRDPARYAAIGAAYGRNTGGFGGVAAPVTGGGGGGDAGGSVFDTGASPVPYPDAPFSSAYPGGSVGSSIPAPGYSTPTAPTFGMGLSFADRFAPIARMAPAQTNQGMVGPPAYGSASAAVTDNDTGVPYPAGPFQGAEAGGGIGSSAPTPQFSTPYRAGRDAIVSSLMRNIASPTAPTGYTPSPDGGGSFGFDEPMAPTSGTSSPPSYTLPGASFAERFGAAPRITAGLQPALGPQLPPQIMLGPEATPPTPSAPPSPMPDDNSDLPRNFGSQFGALPDFDENSFANRFGAGGYYRPGTPSQYYTGGQYGPPARMPPGFTPPFSVDNPQGALPGAPFTPPSAPPSSGDTLTPADLNIPFGGGAGGIMNQGDDDGASFADRFGSWRPNMAGFQSPANDYNTFQQNQPPTVTGTASTYDPTQSGWRTGGMETASGATYDPDAYTAAIQTSLRDRFGGVKYGQPAQNALVQSPGGQQAIVGVNDVGPLVQNRVMDLSTAAMKYFNPTSSPNSGTMPNMQITPYYGSAPPGPVGPVGPTGPMLPTPGVPPPNMGPIPPYTPTTRFVRR